MHKNKVTSLAAFIILCLISFFAFAQQEERVTITTYYPSPFGSYNEIRARRVAIGNEYINPTAYSIPQDTSLIVQNKVGIGTSVPQEALEVKGNIRLSSFTNYHWDILADGDNFTIRENGDNTKKRLTITYPEGRVGIGTTVPREALEVKGNIKLSSQTNYNWDIMADSDNFTIREAGDNSKKRLTVTYPDGNVGIGTTSPGYNLHVANSNGQAFIGVSSNRERDSGFAMSDGSGTQAYVYRPAGTSDLKLESTSTKVIVNNKICFGDATRCAVDGIPIGGFAVWGNSG